MKIYVAHSPSFDYLKELYIPIKESDVYRKNELIFPHLEKEFNSKEVILESDLLIAEVSYQSTGLGIELGIASLNKIPILCIYKKDKNISSSLKYITNNFIEYENHFDMVEKINKYIKNII